jgi:PAS domain S-box-containing protein
MDRQELEKAANTDGIFVFFAAMLVAFGVDIFAGVFDKSHIFPVLFILTVAFVISYIQAYDIFHVNKHRILLSISFHLLWLLAVATIFEIGSLYLALGVQIAYQSNFWFGKRGTILSIEFQILGIAVIYFLNAKTITIEGFADVIRSGGIIIMLTVSYVALLDVARKEISRVKDVSNKLFVTTQRIQLMVNNMSEAMLATDRNGRIIEYNAATLNLIDTNANLHGKYINEVFDLHNDSDETVDVVAQARQENRVLFRDDIFHRYARGDSARLSITANPLLVNYGDKQVNGFTFIISDITKRMSLEEQRDEFISVVSHELRTPVAVTEGNIEIAKMLYKKNRDDPTLTEVLNSAHSQIKYLSELVNDLVVLSMSEQDSSSVKIETFSPIKLGEELIEMFKESAQDKNLALTLEANEDMRTIESSRIFIGEILKHFLTNAIKYTGDGYVGLQIKQENFHTVFSVKDTGRGISKSDQKHIFEKFYRAEEFHTRETGGTGLGLHVSQQLAKKINADITFTSKLGDGSMFNLKVLNRP